MEYLVMLPGPTNVPNRVMNAMLAPIINHRSDDFRVLYKTIVEKTQKVFQTNGEIILLTTSGTGVVEASVINLIKKGDKAIIPVNGEFSTRLADLIDSWGGQAIRISAPPGENPPYDKFEEAFDKNKDVKALYAVYNETSTGTTIRYMDKLGELASRKGAYLIADNYLPGMDDKKFRGLLSSEFRVLVAGGFGDLKGKVFRVGSMGEVSRYHVMRTISSIASAMNVLGVKTNPEASSVAMDKLK